MTFADIMAQQKWQAIWNYEGLLRMKSANKNTLLRHLVLHKESNFNLGDLNDTVIKRVIRNILALLEHKQYALEYQLSHINALTLDYTSVSTSVTTNSNNTEQDDIYAAMPNVAGQNYSRIALSDNDKYQAAWQVVELELSPVYKYLHDIRMWDDKDHRYDDNASADNIVYAALIKE